MPVSVLQYLIQTLENLSSDKFRELQSSVCRYIQREDICNILLKIDPEKLSKRFKSESNSLHFQARCLAGLLTIELSVELIRWIQQTPLPPLSAGENPCGSDERPCEPS